MEECKHRDECGAPLCRIHGGTEWYPEEEICRRVWGAPDWVKQQRKIAKKVKGISIYYFTQEMLEVPFRVTSAVKGINPDKPEEPQLAAWFKRNKGRQKQVKLTKEDLETKLVNLEKARQKRCQNPPPNSEDDQSRSVA